MIIATLIVFEIVSVGTLALLVLSIAGVRPVARIGAGARRVVLVLEIGAFMVACLLPRTYRGRHAAL